VLPLVLPIRCHLQKGVRGRSWPTWLVEGSQVLTPFVPFPLLALDKKQQHPLLALAPAPRKTSNIDVEI
jgi:hypothetical protein